MVPCKSSPVVVFVHVLSTSFRAFVYVFVWREREGGTENMCVRMGGGRREGERRGGGTPIHIGEAGRPHEPKQANTDTIMHLTLAKVDKNEKKKGSQRNRRIGVHILKSMCMHSLFYSSSSWLHLVVITHSLAHRRITNSI